MTASLPITDEVESAMLGCDPYMVTGDSVDWTLYVALYYFGKETNVANDYVDVGTIVAIPEGWYVLEENNMGFHNVNRYASEAEAVALFTRYATRYAAFLAAREFPSDVSDVTAVFPTVDA